MLALHRKVDLLLYASQLCCMIELIPFVYVDMIEILAEITPNKSTISYVIAA